MPAIIVNMFGSPGAGKSTTATGVFSKLKLLGVNCEYVPEVAKDFTWEGRQQTLTFQAYVHAKQLRNIERLMGKVDVIVTDSPPLLSAFYAKFYGVPYPESFCKWIMDCHERYLQPSLSYYLTRVKPYNPAGRNQDEAEAAIIANAMAEWVGRFKQKFMPFFLEGDARAIETVVFRVRNSLRSRALMDVGEIIGAVPDMPGNAALS